MSYELVDCCPVPKALVAELLELKKQTGCTFASIYRGTDAAGLLAQCGKHDQAWLYANLPAGQANSPGHSTHELRSDGVAYRGPSGRRLRYWQVGMDIDDAHVAAFCQAARMRGWIATITYPTSAVEHHHVNFRREPVLKIFRPLKRGSRGPRVTRLTKRLAYIRSPHNGEHYLNGKRSIFDQSTVAAVRGFQLEHHLHPDGVVGPHTAAQIQVSFRRQRKARG